MELGDYRALKLKPFVCGFLFFVFSVPATAFASAFAHVSYVGCENTNGSKASPPASDLNVDLPKQIASKLSLYAGTGMIVLAPRGWKCEATNGTAGVSLWVHPANVTYQTKGPIVSESIWGGNETGNSYVVSYGGRYFPDIINGADVEDFISGTDQTKNQFLIPRYRSDTIAYFGKHVLQFWSPAGHTGLGQKVLGPSSLAVDGLISISDNPTADMWLLLFGVRLSSTDAVLMKNIIQYSRNCSVKPNANKSCFFDTDPSEGD